MEHRPQPHFFSPSYAATSIFLQLYLQLWAKFTKHVRQIYDNVTTHRRFMTDLQQNAIYKKNYEKVTT